MAGVTEEDLKEAEERGARRVREIFDDMWKSGEWEGQVSIGFAAVFDERVGELGAPQGEGDVDLGLLRNPDEEVKGPDGVYREVHVESELERLHRELARLVAFYKFQQERWNDTTPEQMATWDEDDRDPVNVACHIYGHVAQEVRDVVMGRKVLGDWRSPE